MLQTVQQDMFGAYVFLLLLAFTAVPCSECCFIVFNGQWKPVALEERTRKADLVVTANILSTAPIPNNTHFYEATFEVLNVLKGWDLLKRLHYQGTGPVKFMEPKIIASAEGFADTRHCFSHVEVGESYALFLGFNPLTKRLIAKYDDIFGAADKLFKRTERDILKTLGKCDYLYLISPVCEHIMLSQHLGLSR